MDSAASARAGTTPPAQPGLTRVDIQAFRECDYITARHDDTSKDKLTLCKRVPKKGPFGDEERAHEVACRTRIDDSCSPEKGGSAFASIDQYAHTRTEISSLVAFLKPGDELEVEFVAMLCANAWHQSAITRGGDYGGCDIVDGLPLRVQGVRFWVVRGAGAKRTRYPFLVNVLVVGVTSIGGIVRGGHIPPIPAEAERDAGA